MGPNSLQKWCFDFVPLMDANIKWLPRLLKYVSRIKIISIEFKLITVNIPISSRSCWFYHGDICSGLLYKRIQNRRKCVLWILWSQLHQLRWGSCVESRPALDISEWLRSLFHQWRASDVYEIQWNSAHIYTSLSPI